MTNFIPNVDALRFVPFETVIDTAFWHVLAKKKLDEFRLATGPFSICGTYSNCSSVGISPRLTIDAGSFCESEANVSTSNVIFRLNGQLITLNSADEFKNKDKQELINTTGDTFFQESLSNSNYLKAQDKVISFLLLTYCDLKRHKFYFWCAYPAVLHDIQPKLYSFSLLVGLLPTQRLDQLFEECNRHLKDFNSVFFTIHIPEENTEKIRVSSFDNITFGSPTYYIGFCDPSTDPQFPGWPLRNMLYAISCSLTEDSRVKIICYREHCNMGRRHCDNSVLLDVGLKPIDGATCTQYVGWEKWNKQLRPRVIDLSTTMDPVKLSEAAVDLNLKLLKWRLCPDLKLDLFRSTKCLLIGAGTLGCNVARQLMAWGIRKITFVDNSTISMSNPIRQSLFSFDDAKTPGSSKATVAARALKDIFPGIISVGHVINIPMPGHPVSMDNSFDSSLMPRELHIANLDTNVFPLPILETYSSCCKLDELISSHDVVFLLTDTRESRWLPTLLASVHCKLVINSALGFDTFLVMRHGVASPGISPSNTQGYIQQDLINNLEPNSNLSKPCKSISGANLGCYFCNDVVGPTNSTQNRSLDQQCTVTRPGVLMMAASIAVELLISVLQNENGSKAFANVLSDPVNFDFSDICDSFSLVPHQIRGFLASYTHILPATTAFSQCSACSQPVLDCFKNDGFAFLLKVFNDAAYLEKVCGLEELHRTTECDAVIALSDMESD